MRDLNLLIFCFLKSKGVTDFEVEAVVKELSILLEDKSYKVRFVALEGLAYLTNMMSSHDLIKLASKTLGTKPSLSALKKRVKMLPRVSLSVDEEVQYPDLRENEDLVKILIEMVPEQPNQNGNSLQRTQSILVASEPLKQDEKPQKSDRKRA